MIRRPLVLAALLAFASAAPALAAGGAVLGLDAVAGGNKTLCVYDAPGGLCAPFAMINPATHTATTLPSFVASAPIDITAYGAVADGVTNVAPAVNAAIAAGYRRLYLPPNTVYIPASDAIPGDLDIYGGDWRTSVISVANRATGNLLVGARTRLHDVAIRSVFCDTQANPFNTQKVCPVHYAQNISDGVFAITNWAFASSWYGSGSQVTGPGGVVSTDSQAIGIQHNLPGGDGIYVGTGLGGVGAENTSAIRLVTGGNGDVGLHIFDGYNDGSVPASSSHKGILVEENSNTGISQHIVRAANARSLLIEDAGSTSLTSDVLSIGLTKQTSGAYLNFYQGNSAYSGDILTVNAGAGGGSFAGNFFRFQKNGVAVSTLDNSGNLSTTGTMYAGNTITSATGLATASSFLQVQTAYTPATSGATCGKGQIAWDANYTYVCVATNTWKRSALGAF